MDCGKMIVSEKDSTWTKIKWYIVCFVGSIIILLLLSGVLPFLVYKILQHDYWRNPFSALFLGGNKTLFYA
jgi:hypothetical protein